MTHASQLSPLSSDYFSHKPRSFLSHHTDFDEKLSTGGGPSTPTIPRGRTRQVAYTQPSPSLPSSPPSRPRVPLRRTLLRLFLLLSLISVATLTWRCESVGCKSRGGGALVGDYIGGGSVLPLEMPGVIKGWGTPEGVDLSNIPGWGKLPDVWESQSWGGERQKVGQEGKDSGSSTLDAFKGREGEGDAGQGELVEAVKGEVQWDNEEEGFGSAEVGVVEGTGTWSAEDVAGPLDGEVAGLVGDGGPPAPPAEGAVVKDTNAAPGDAGDDIAAEGTAPSDADAGSAVAVALIDAPPAVDQTNLGAEPRSQDGGAELVLLDASGGAQDAVQQADGAAASFEQKLEQKGWLGSMGGLF
ncbi:hypothetical protein E8E13_009430 [Curvularia kusanoi]|uniref:Uncharacterized protein n=1 Tax=Curvularia kusanoi TaxID=90978 RepID=A0A9P4TFA7_CURKU|nr:hypothetical protein E8E13_009430 [Curvularia kusanoi]